MQDILKPIVLLYQKILGWCSPLVLIRHFLTSTIASTLTLAYGLDSIPSAMHKVGIEMEAWQVLSVSLDFFWPRIFFWFVVLLFVDYLWYSSCLSMRKVFEFLAKLNK